MKEHTTLKKLIGQNLEELLDIKLTEVQEDLPFIQLGLDSESAVELVAYINKTLGLTCSASVIFDHPSINKLTDFLWDLLCDETQTGQTDIIPVPDAVPVLPGNSEAQSLAIPEEKRKKQAVAIIGLSGRYPGAADLEQFWHNLKHGLDSVKEIPEDRWDVAHFYDPEVSKEDKIYSKWLGSLEHIDEFDPLFFNISPFEAECMDPQQRIFLQEAWKALEDAGLQSSQLSEQECGTYVGVMSNEYVQLLAQHPRFSSAQALTGNANSIFAARLAYFLNFRGPAIAVDTACSSSLVAMHLAYQALLNGEIDIGIAGGVTLFLSVRSYMQMCRANMLSPDGKCKPFDNSANGFVPAEGAGVVVLKRLTDAEKADDQIYGIIRGSAINQDGKTNGITAPSVQSQIALQKTLYQRFSIDPEKITYVEAHGTGTKLGDPIELEALSTSFKDYTEKKQYCGIGSVKSNIGHTSAAAGVASVHKVLLMLKHKQLVSTLHFKRANEQFDFTGSPFYVTQETKPWAVGLGEKRCVAVSSFGFSGTNAHVVIEEYISPKPQKVKGTVKATTLEPAIIVLSAKNQERLQAYVRSLLEYIQNNGSEVNLVELAYTLQVGREAMEERLALIVKSMNELEEKLSYILAGREDIEGIYRGNRGRNKNSLAAYAADEDMIEMLQAWISKGKYTKLMDFWVQGWSFDWNKLYGEDIPRRVRAPTYPFARERYWVENINQEPPTGGKIVRLPDLSLISSEIPQPNFQSTSLQTQPLVNLSPTSKAMDFTQNQTDESCCEAPVELHEYGEGIFCIRMIRDSEMSEKELSESLIPGLERIFRTIEEQQNVKVVLLMGGEQQFLSGAFTDRGAFLKKRAHLLPLDCKVPVIAVMKGHAAGIGWLLGALSDLLVCSEESSYEYFVEGSGWVCSEEEFLLFQERFGNEFAQELLSSGKSYTGGELQTKGLGMPIVPKHQVDTYALALAHRLCEMPQKSLILLKKHLSKEVAQRAGTLTSSFTPISKDNRCLNFGKKVTDFERYCLNLIAIPKNTPAPGESKKIHIDSDVVHLEDYSNGIVLVSLCDKDYKNTFSDAFVLGMQNAFDKIGKNPEFKVVILTGYDCYFSCGGTRENLLAIQQGRVKFTDTRIFDLPLQCEIPVIAAMQGHGIGAGWSMGIFCDCVIFSEESLYISPYMKYGFTPGAGSTLIFPEKFGKDLGREILLSAKEYKADELKLRGMNSPVLPRSDVKKFALNLAAQLALSSREVLVELKKQSCKHLSSRLDEIYAQELQMHEKCFVGNQEVSVRIEKYFNEGVLATGGIELPEPETSGNSVAETDAAILARIRKTLRATLASELHVNQDQIDDYMQFIELGLDSIICVTWVRKLNSEFGLSINATTVYKYPTIDEFSKYVIEESKARGLFKRREKVVGDSQLRKEETTTMELPVTVLKKESIHPTQSSAGKAPSMDLPRTLELKPISHRAEATQAESIAVIGMSGQFPKSKTLDEFWDNLVHGRDCISEVPPTRWDIKHFYDSDPLAPGKTCCKWMGVLEEAGKFDPLFFNISPSEARWIDPQQRLFLQNAWSCIEASGYHFSQLSASKCGVFVGCSTGEYGQLMGKEEINAQVFMGGAASILAARISYILNLQGPCLSIDTACSSSLVAIASACDSLVLKNSDLALAGGVCVMAGPSMHIMTSKAGMLSEDGRCYTFDQRANGFVPGEGVGVILLKRLSDAERDRDQIYGVVRGWGVNQDGKTNGITAPNPESQTRLQKEIYEKYSINPEDIQLIEAHGTGTKLGDPIEVEGLKEAFKPYTAKQRYCALGSVKSNIGHLLAAAGISGVIKLLLSLQHKKIPPTINYENLNEHIDLKDTPFYITTECRDWYVAEGKRRLSAISSFGFSGTNAHLVIQEYIGQTIDGTSVDIGPEEPQMMVLSARNKARLKEYAKKLLEFTKVKGSGINLVDLAYTLQVGREAMEERLGFTARSMKELEEKLKAFIEDKEETEDLYLGQVKRDKHVIEELTADDDLQLAMDAWIEKRKHYKFLNLWVKGFAIEWNRFYRGNKPQRINAPTYPFAREHYWIVNADHRTTNVLMPEKEVSIAQNDGVQVRHNRAEYPAFNAITNITCGERQKKFIDNFVKKYEARTINSKNAAIRYRKYFSDQRTPIYFNPLLKEIHYPITYEKDSGAYVYDIDGNRYIDIACDYGVNLFGHRPEFLSEAIKGQLDRGDALSGRYDTLGKAAQLFCEITGHDRVLFCQSGTESVMSALRLARAFTGKSKVAIFEGAYHGHYDSFLNTRTPGVVDSMVSDTLVLEYGESESLNSIARHSSELAAILVEPVQSSHIDLQPQEFLRSLRQIATQEKVVLIFDEMISGFRIHTQGSQGYWGIRADLATYGKILGGGFTAGAIGGKEEIMKWADGGIWQYGDQSKPTPITYLAGTHTQNPLKMAATLAVLREIKEKSPGLQNELNKKVEFLCGKINDYIKTRRAPVSLLHFGSQFRFKFLEKQFSLTQAIFLYLLNYHGVRYNLYGNCFLTTAHSDQDIQHIIDVVKESLDVLFSEGFFFGATEQSIPASAANVSSSYGEEQKFVCKDVNQSPEQDEGLPAKTVTGLSIAQLESRVKQDIKAFIGNFLQIPVANLDTEENFGNLGIDSIMSMNLIKAIREEYNIKLSPAVIVDADTIGKLSRELLANHEAALAEYYQNSEMLAKAGVKEESSFHTYRGNSEISPSGFREFTSARKGNPVEGFRTVGETQDIAIIGMSVNFPEAKSLDEFWQNLIDKRTSIREVPKQRWAWEKYCAPQVNGSSDNPGKTISRWGAFVDNPEFFDPLFFNITPRDAELMDPQERLILQEAYHAVEDAGLNMGNLSGSKTGVFIGYEYSGYREYCKQIGAYRKDVDLINQGSSNPSYYLANRVSYTFDFRGPSESVNVNCASSAVSVNRAYYSLLNRESDLALAGGVCLNLIPEDFMTADKLLSPDGSCRVFDERANGYTKGEGCGIIVLKRFKDAQRDGDRIYAVVKACSQNNRGLARSLSDVKPEALSNAIKACHQRSNVTADTVHYIEVDGYCTKWGDAVEYEAIKRVFTESHSTRHNNKKYCGLGSLKGNIGHLDPASGIASLIKVALSLHHRQFPATITCETVNEFIDVHEDSHPLYLIRENIPFSALQKDSDSPVRAGINSFADSGVNVHILLEEFQERHSSSPQLQPESEPYLIVLSAKTEDRLKAYAEKLLKFVERVQTKPKMPVQPARISLRNLAYTLQVGREVMERRLAIQVHSLKELAKKLQDFIQGRKDIEDLYFGQVLRNTNVSAAPSADPEMLARINFWISQGDSSQLSEHWVKGWSIDWNKLYGEDKPRRISAPTYPFAEKGYWVKQPIFQKANVKIPIEAYREGEKKQISTEPASIETVNTESRVSSNEPKIHPLKKRIKSIFSELYCIEEEEVDEDRPFFELGMNSINVVEFVEQLKKQLHLSLEVSDIFNYPTFRALTEYTAPDIDKSLTDSQSKDLGTILSEVDADKLDVEQALELINL